MLTFFVPGVPKPQGSKRAFVHRSTGRAVVVETSGVAHKDWRAVVAFAGTEKMAGQPPLQGPLAVMLTFQLPRPKSHPKTRITWPISRPDVDKLARAILDALTHVCWVDDAQIVDLHTVKCWAQPDIHNYVGVVVDVHQVAEILV